MPNNIPIIVKFECFWIWNKEKYHIALQAILSLPSPTQTLIDLQFYNILYTFSYIAH